jgi:hypothetical protein
MFPVAQVLLVSGEYLEVVWASPTLKKISVKGSYGYGGYGGFDGVEELESVESVSISRSERAGLGVAGFMFLSIPFTCSWVSPYIIFQEEVDLLLGNE